MSYEAQASLTMIIICVVLLLSIFFGTNACTAEEWNDGQCPKCHVRYELRAVNDGLRYYACPTCGNEVERFGG